MPPVEYERIASLWGLSAQVGYGWGLVDTWKELWFPDAMMYYTPVGNSGVRNIPFFTTKLSCPAPVGGDKRVYVKSGFGYDWPTMISGQLLITKKIDGKDYRKKITYRDFLVAYEQLEAEAPGQGIHAAVEVHNFSEDDREVWFRIDILEDFVAQPTPPELSITAFTDTTVDILWTDFPSLSKDAGLCYSTDPSPTMQNTTVSYGENYFPSSPPVVTTLTDLTPGTTYYVRSYVVASAGINYYRGQHLGHPDSPTATEGIGPYYGNETTFTTDL